MKKNFFPGMQEGERILYHTSPHPSIRYLYIAGALAAGLFLLLGFQAVFFAVFPNFLMQLVFLVLPVMVTVLIMWWIHKSQTETELFITDRRVIKFAPTSPTHKSTRSLFWDQTVKLKTYHQNPLFDRALGLGSLTLHAKNESDDVDIDHIIYHSDLGNYIDKILYTFHNAPAEMPNIREFVPKPRGQRY